MSWEAGLGFAVAVALIVALALLIRAFRDYR